MSDSARLAALQSIHSRAAAMASGRLNIHKESNWIELAAMIEGLAQVLLQEEYEKRRAWAPARGETI